MIGPGIVEGIGSAVSFGAGDFLGELAARHARGMVVAAGSELVGTVALLVLLGIDPAPVPPLTTLAIAAAAGMFGVLGIAALYRGLAMGSMGLVAAISALGSVLIPLAASVVVYRATVGAGQLVGVACAAAAGAAATGAARDRATRMALGLAVVAAIAFGMWFVLLDLAAANAALWALIASRVAASIFIIGLALMTGRDSVDIGLRRAWPLIVFAGLLDVSGNALFVLSSGELAVGVAAALSSIYPLVTMLLARIVLREALPPMGLLGVGLAVIGIALISLG